MSLRDYFSRHVLKNINVYKIDDFSLEPPEIHKLDHEVITHSMKPKTEIKTVKRNLTEGMKCKALSVKISDRRVKAKSQRVRQYVKQDIKAYRHEVKSRIKTYDAVKLIRDMPLEFSDMLKYQTARPKLLPNEIVLAYYGPIVEGAVIKLVWNKQRGTLLVWYNPQSRHYKARGLYLIRKLGFGAKTEWRWE